MNNDEVDIFLYNDREATVRQVNWLKMYVNNLHRALCNNLEK